MEKAHAIRIIGGSWRGRRLRIPTGTEVRPTPDRARETLFNWLGGNLSGVRCLDLYAGTGVLGLEALSRGARSATFVERDPKLAHALEARIAELGAEARVIRDDVESALTALTGIEFGVVFLDPPYEVPLEPVLERLPEWLAPGARIYVERLDSGADTLADLALALPGAHL
ncbi:MAG TPA: 16S rRNA (guanine(966)-N(2))-methyltransferase RsmD, partial [Gammaproteobacteria bacterium]